LRRSSLTAAWPLVEVRGGDERLALTSNNCFQVGVRVERILAPLDGIAGWTMREASSAGQANDAALTRIGHRPILPA